MRRYPKFGLRLGAVILLAFAVSTALAVQEKEEPPRIRVQSALVTVPVLVTDPQGRFVSGLSADSFKLYQDDRPEPISLFLTSEDPVKIALLLDTSRSTSAVLPKIKKAAARFLLQLRPKDLALVASFDSEIQVLCPFSSDPKELSNAIKSAKPGGVQTRIRDAIIEIAQKRLRAISGRKAIVLLTDGEDHGSTTSARELFAGVASSSTLIYSVFYPVDPRKLMKEITGMSPSMPESTAAPKDGSKDPWKQSELQATAFLEQVSDLSAGRFYRSDITELDSAFKQISDELRSQYLLGFYPDKSKLDGQMHSLDVRVSAPGATVRSRRQYRAAP